jgi:hypothetical protein
MINLARASSAEDAPRCRWASSAPSPRASSTEFFYKSIDAEIDVKPESLILFLSATPTTFVGVMIACAESPGFEDMRCA